MTARQHFILGAAGHVDHGKTALIKALTGTQTDRLKEERERGISIELGFAQLDLGAGMMLGVVDMPGHEKFVKQMVSGAGGVDLAFLLVAADEGVMPQTIEHLGILDSLGVKSGVVVMSKADLVDSELLAVASEEAVDLVAGTFLEGQPVVPVSAHTGQGLDVLKEALLTAALALPVRCEGGAFRLPVDRVFTLPGVGVVVTGTCWAGAVEVGDKLELEPGGLTVRVREVQVHGQKADKGASGQRLALALHGVKKDEISRGLQLVSPGSATVTRRVDLRLNLMPHYRGAVKNRQRLHVNHAGREVLGRIVLLDEAELGAEVGPRTGLAQLHLEDELVAQGNDRLVLRFYSPVTCLAGGVILDASAPPHKRFDSEVLANLQVMETGDPAELFRQRLHRAGTTGLALADALGQQDDPQAFPVGRRLYHRELMDDLRTQIGTVVDAYADRFPLRLGVPKEECRRKCKFKSGANEWNAICQALAPSAPWVLAGDRIAATADGPVLTQAMASALAVAQKEVQQFRLDWPGVDNWVAGSPVFRAARGDVALVDFKAPEVVRFLVDHGHVVAISSEFIVTTDALMALLTKLRAQFAVQPEMAFGEFRVLSGLSRKLGIPLLEYLDQTDRTVRVGDVRRAGDALVAENQEQTHE